MIDLRSDFLSRPTSEMIEAMMRAARDPVAFGPREDPTVSALERLAAEMLGTEDALFCATCAAANQIAIHVHCRPGDAIVTHADAHIVTSEGGAPAALSGATIFPVSGRYGCAPLQDIAEAIETAGSQRCRASLVVVENTHVRSGGTVLAPAYVSHLAVLAHERQAAVHLDGSRLFNAAAYHREPARALAAGADSVSVSLNKGLAAPMGAILAGSAGFIRQAERVRQMFGGTWRPANIPAAAAIVALRTMVERLSEDHRTARQIAEGLSHLPHIAIDLDQVQTNIVLVGIPASAGTPDAFADRLKAHDVLALPFAGRQLRLVTWHGIDSLQARHVVAAFADVLSAGPAGTAEQEPAAVLQGNRA